MPCRAVKPLTQRKIRVYIDANGKDRPLVEVLKDIKNYMTTNTTTGKPDLTKLKVLHPSITELATPDSLLSVTSMNSLVHNRNFSVNAADISKVFSNVLPLLEALNA